MGDHVFISYAREDQDFVLKLAANLKERGIRVWLDQWDIPTSADWDLTIDNALYDCAQFLIVLSPAARDSREVRGELRIALDEHKHIVPVLYQTCRIPRQLRLIQHVDFTARGPDDGAALGKVLDALGVPESPLPTPEPEMILIPAGEFLRGTREENVDAIAAKYNTEPKRIKRELPQRKVFVEEFEIAKSPVTNAEFQRFVEATGYRTQAEQNGYGNIWKGSTWEPVEGADWRHPQGPDSSLEGKTNHPVVQVNWHDARAYCEWLSEKIGKSYRLPLEKEWEKAARGTDGREFPWGDEWSESRCNTAEGDPGTTTSVGKYSLHGGDSPYGVADMAGNVWEWCADWFQAYRGKSFPDTYYGERSKRVLRGSSWKDSRVGARCAYREGDPPTHMDDRIGFRCVGRPSFWRKMLLCLKRFILSRGWFTVLVVLIAIGIGVFFIPRLFPSKYFATPVVQTPHPPSAPPYATQQPLSTPTPVPTFPPIEILSELNRDDFSFASSGWDNYATDGKAIVGYDEDREYFLQIYDTQLIYAAIWGGGGLYDNGIFQADALAPRDAGSALTQGIVLGWNKEDSKHYAFEFTYTGLCRFLEGTGSWWRIERYGTIPAFDPEKPFHVVTVRVRNNEAIGYVDEKFCASYVMPEYRRGVVGVVGSVKQGGARLYFDNFRIWDLP